MGEEEYEEGKIQEDKMTGVENVMKQEDGG